MVQNLGESRVELHMVGRGGYSPWQMSWEPQSAGEMTVSEEPQREVGQEQSCLRLLCEGGGATSPHSFHQACSILR